ncbi:MAG: aminoglycoside 6-adenylyltransferase [Oscillospiraceae bacterium]|nr:aminoglycoside 6-adenylyltransferase [Oscillospiraceae bacterium]
MRTRSEREMFDLILGTAKADARVRAAVMNGSRASPSAPKDIFQDYDIVYVVAELASFTSDHSWIDVFGARVMLQMPEAMRYPGGQGHFNYQMLFEDYNRIDLNLVPAGRLDLIGSDSQSVALLDKDGILPAFAPASDADYLVRPPSELFFSSCCNNFWWCLQNVAKGIARGEAPYALTMLDTVVRAELRDVIEWHIGAQTGFTVTAGKMGRYFKLRLDARLYEMYLKTYAGYDHIWDAVFVMCALFSELARGVAGSLGYGYNHADEEKMTAYLRWVCQKTGGPRGP